MAAKRKRARAAADSQPVKTERYAMRLYRPGQVTHLMLAGEAVVLNMDSVPLSYRGKSVPVPEQALLKELYEAGYVSLVEKIED